MEFHATISSPDSKVRMGALSFSLMWTLMIFSFLMPLRKSSGRKSPDAYFRMSAIFVSVCWLALTIERAYALHALGRSELEFWVRRLLRRKMLPHHSELVL